MVSSLLSKLANYTNLTQGVREHEEAEDGVRRVTVMVGTRWKEKEKRNVQRLLTKSKLVEIKNRNEFALKIDKLL